MKDIIFPESIVVSVNYALSLKEMIRETGIQTVLGYVNATYFPPEKETGTEEVEIKFREYNTAMSGAAILEDLKKSELKPVKIGQFLALCKVLAKLDKPIRVACLGTTWDHEGGIRAVVCFINDGACSQFVIRFVDECWDTEYRFPYCEN